MWFRRPERPSPDPIPATDVSRDETDDAALDAVAAILRALGEATSRGAGVAAELEAWARHVLVLGPPPGADLPTAGRDWRGLRRDVVAHVRDERAAVSSSMADLQDAVWLVVHGVSQAIVGDSAADADAARQLERLRVAAAGSTAELKATAMATVQQLSQIIDERSERQRGLARELGERVEGLRVELDDTRREAETDPLTQVANRSVLQRELPRAAQLRTLTTQPICLAIVDIDHFKTINDRHGHQTGDSALAAFAGALVRSFPRRRDVVTRFGGDEFAVILHDAYADEGCRLAERFLMAVRELEVPGPPEPIRLSASVGVAEAFSGESADAWFARADRALYAAKAAGRDRVAVAGEDPVEGSRLAA